MFKRLLILGSVQHAKLENITEKLLNTSLVAEATGSRKLPGDLQMFDGAVLSVDSFDLMEWVKKVRVIKDIPLFWWCSDPLPRCTADFQPTGPDALLHDGMNSDMIAWALTLGQSHFQRYNKLMMENDQLKNKLEERKVVDRAKEIVAELKGISLADAYQFLRTQAMRERRNILEVSRSIVTAFEIIRSEKESKRR